jgi:hypothetical protein
MNSAVTDSKTIPPGIKVGSAVLHRDAIAGSVPARLREQAMPTRVRPQTDGR